MLFLSSRWVVGESMMWVVMVIMARMTSLIRARCGVLCISFHGLGISVVEGGEIGLRSRRLADVYRTHADLAGDWRSRG